jgi:hypothetical protein
MRRFFRWLISAVAPKGDQRSDARSAPDDEMAWFFPPDEVHAGEPWDRYWSGQIEHGLGPHLQDMFCDDDALLDAMEVRGLKTVLCVGSGISQEPHALAAAGLDVTALDISAFAMRFASETALTDGEGGRFFNWNRTRPGGTVRCAVGSLLDPEACPGPFDVVIERKTLQLFPESERAAALSAVTARLSERGILLTHCHDGCWRPPATPRHVIEPLLGPAGFHILRYGSSVPSDGRVAMVVMSTG